MNGKYIKWFKEIGLNDVALVGGKNANLGEMYQHLSSLHVKVPNGFAVTSQAYLSFLQYNNLLEPLRKLLYEELKIDDMQSLQSVGKKCRALIQNGKFPEEIKLNILKGYAGLRHEYGDDVLLAVRSSATAEDSLEASFAGQNDSYLNIKGDEELLDAYKRCLASNFTDRSIHYKYDNNFDYLKVHLCVVVMKMVRSDISSSGVMFSLDTETGFNDVVFVNAAYGFCENIVQGSINPDSFYVHKPTYKNAHRAILKRSLGTKMQKMVFSSEINKDNIAVEHTKNIPTTQEERNRFCITDEDVLTLASYALKIEEHYSSLAHHNKPMDMEWAKDGLDGELYMVQARPETVISQKKGNTLELYHLRGKSKVLVQGLSVGMKIGTGRAHVITNSANLKDFKAGEVLVADTTTPDWEPIMKLASAIVTNRGGRTCHASILSRELGIPAIVGAEGATEILLSADEVTVSCAEGEIGFVYDGKLDFEITQTDLSKLPKTKTKIMMNLGNPELAFSLASLPVDGIGLARMEFIINAYIKAHPMAIAHPERVDEQTRKELETLSFAYDSMEDFFVKTLSEGVATIAASVYPKPCVVRMSDFKTNEYATLLGGKFFEPDEPNPMIGFRGAARYAHPNYEDGFALECEAMKRVRNEMGFTNVI